MPKTKTNSDYDWSNAVEVDVESLSPISDAGYAKQIGRGIAQGAGDLATTAAAPGAAIEYIMSILTGSDYSQPVTPGQKTMEEASKSEGLSEWQQLMLLTGDDELMPPQPSPGGRKRLEEQIEEIPEGGVLQEGTRRITRSLPFVAGGGALAKEVIGRELLGLSGKTIAKKLGLGETGQSLFDVAFSLTPNPQKFIQPGSKLIKAAETGKFVTQKELVEGARQLGMSEAQIAPLVREGWFADVLKKVSSKGTATSEALSETKGAIGNAFETLKKSENANRLISPKVYRKLVSELESANSGLTVKAQDVVKKELENLYKGKKTPSALFEFTQKMNRYFSELPELQAMKKPILNALKQTDPNLAQKFSLANTLSNRFRAVEKQMRPGMWSKLANLAEIGMGLKALASFKLPLALPTIWGTRKMAELMTTNPRFMNLHKKMLTSINAGQLKAAEKSLSGMIGMISKIDPEAAAEIRSVSFEELQELMKED